MNLLRDATALQVEPEAERTVIGALLLSGINGDQNCTAVVFTELTENNFTDCELRPLFAAARRLYERGEQLERTLWLREIGKDLARDEAVSLLLECGQAATTTATVGSYVRLVADAARQRRLVCAANDALNAARNVRSRHDVDTISASLRSALDAIEASNSSDHAPEIVRLADVEPEPVEWIWPGRIASGKVTLFAGDPGLGKSLLMLDIAARVSRRAPWPDTPHELQTPGSVVLLSAEDDIADTIRPRLDAHDADCSRIIAIKSVRGSDGEGPYGRPFDLGRDIEQLRFAVDSVSDCRLVVIDPVSAYMGRSDSHVNAEVRAVLAPLAELATEKKLAVLCVTHLRKGEGAAMYRAMGSLAFVAAARAAWAIVRDRDAPKRRLLLAVKNNLASDVAAGMAYAIESHGVSGAPLVCWERLPITITADEAMAPDVRKRGPAAEDRDEAAEWLRTALVDGPRKARDLVDDASDVGFSRRTIERAFRQLDGISERPGFGQAVLWSLPNLATIPARDPHLKQPGENDETWREWRNTEENEASVVSRKGPSPILATFPSSGVQPGVNGHATSDTEWL